MCCIINFGLAQYADITDFSWGLWAGITRLRLGLYGANNITTGPLNIAYSLRVHYAKILMGSDQLLAVAIGRASLPFCYKYQEKDYARSGS